MYGPHDKFDLERSHVFGATVTTGHDGGGVPSRSGATGEEARDLLHVSDLVDFVERAVDRQQTACELVNVGAGYALAIKDLVTKIVAASGKALEIKHDLSATDDQDLLWRSTSAGQKLCSAWAPRVPLGRGHRRYDPLVARQPAELRPLN